MGFVKDNNHRLPSESRATGLGRLSGCPHH